MGSKKPDQSESSKPFNYLALSMQNEVLEQTKRLNESISTAERLIALMTPKSSELGDFQKLTRELQQPWSKLQPMLNDIQTLTNAYKQYVDPAAEIHKAFMDSVALQSKLVGMPGYELHKQLMAGAAASRTLNTSFSVIGWLKVLQSVPPFPWVKMDGPSFNRFESSILAALRRTEQPFRDLITNGALPADLMGFGSAIRQEVLTRQTLETVRLRTVEGEGHGAYPLEEEAENIEHGFLTSVPNLLRNIDSNLLVPWEGACQALNQKSADWVRHTIISLRELVTSLLHRFAPDEQIDLCVGDPNAPSDLSDRFNGRPTRKARLTFIYLKLRNSQLKDFYTAEIKANLELIDILNKGAHITASAWTDKEVRAILRKVESLVVVLIEISAF